MTDEKITVDIWELIRVSDGVVMYRVSLPSTEILIVPQYVANVVYYRPDDYEWRKVEDG